MDTIKAALYNKPQVDDKTDINDDEDFENLKKDIPESDSKLFTNLNFCEVIFNGYQMDLSQLVNFLGIG